MCVLHFMVSNAHNNDNSFSKLSPFIRHSLLSISSDDLTRTNDSPSIMAFVKTKSHNRTLLELSGCRVYDKLGDVFIAEIPFNIIQQLVDNDDIVRVEAQQSCSVLLDTTRLNVDFASVQAGNNIPRAYTGKGVVMGIMDVGFDLTSPNFFSRDLQHYRIHSFWDMLAPEKDGKMPVGSCYEGAETIFSLKHSTDNLIISHGTHTLGIAAGSGYDSNYIGVAPESEICLVNNAVVEDSVFIAPEDEGKYTSATDALGFKYIFDYAEKQGKPCVISFSEGSYQGFGEDNLLFYEALQSLVGPGRILVASAGNEGVNKCFMRKPIGNTQCGSFVYSPYNEAYFILKSASDFDMLIKCYGGESADKISISSNNINTSKDSVYNASYDVEGDKLEITISSYQSAFNANETVYEMLIKGNQHIGGSHVPLSIQLSSDDAEIQMFSRGCIFVENDKDSSLCDASSECSILTPASAPAVIAVGATSYREGITNYKGEYLTWNNGSDGVIAPYSSLGPTFDGRLKPEVVAPGTNVISSYSSYYIEACPDASDVQSDITRYEYNGRIYSWNANTGTSMSSPVVGGIIALWLEANPNLSPDDIRDIFAETCMRRDTSIEYPNNIFGHGEINAYRGLLKILGIDGIEGLESEAHDYVLIPTDDGFDIRFNELLNKDVRLDVFNTDGRLVLSKDLLAGLSSYHIVIDNGVYAVRIKKGGAYKSMLVRV